MTTSSFHERRPGRPRAIPLSLVPKVHLLYREGLGYRRIAKELEADGLAVDYSTVRRVIKAALSPPSQ